MKGISSFYTNPKKVVFQKAIYLFQDARSDTRLLLRLVAFLNFFAEAESVGNGKLHVGAAILC